MRRDVVLDAILRERRVWPEHSAAHRALDEVMRSLKLDELDPPGQPGGSVRAGSPRTSVEALAAALPSSGTLRRIILEIVRFNGPVTDEAILNETVFWGQSDRPVMASSARTRRSELVDLGWVREVDQDGVTEAGNAAIRWGLTELAADYYSGTASAQYYNETAKQPEGEHNGD